MAKSFRRRPDDDKYDDENFETTPSGVRILRDGGRARVSLMDAQAVHLHDGFGNPVGSRPGFVVSDSSNHAEREQAYADYEADLVAAYKTDPRNGRLTRVPDTRDAVTMDDILARYVRELRNG